MSDDSASKATTKVKEVAANVQQATRTRRITGSKAEAVARRYFDAIAARDLDAAVAMWADGGRENVRGQVDVTAPEGVRSYIGGLLDAVPDLRFEILSTTTQDDHCAVQWRLTGTFAGPGSMLGLQPTGHPITVEGIDLLTIRDGLIQSNDVFPDSIAVPRQIGMMPPQGSTADQRMMAAFNAKTRLTSRLAGEAELVSEGVWVVQGWPGRCSVYLIEDDGGVTLFDAGARTMVRSVASAGAKLGGIRRIVLGHAHTDHRGTAPALGVPVLCHPPRSRTPKAAAAFATGPRA